MVIDEVVDCFDDVLLNVIAETTVIALSTEIENVGD